MSTPAPVPPLRVFSGSLLGLIAWIVGFAMSGIGGHELLTSLRCGSQPTPLTVAELANRGPTGGDYVTLRDFEFQWNGYVYCQDEHGQWTSCDVPLRVTGSEAPPRVLVRTYGVRNEQELRNQLASRELTGVVTSRGLFGEFGAALAAYNPGIDPAACWIVNVSERPHDAKLLGAIFAGGVGLFTLGIFLFAYVRPSKSPHDAVLRMMSPLIVVVEGLHALANLLPAGSGRICGAIVFASTAALATWGGFRLWQLSRASAGDSGMGVEILSILALDFGVSLALVALSYMFLAPRPELPAEATLLPPAGAGA